MVDLSCILIRPDYLPTCRGNDQLCPYKTPAVTPSLVTKGRAVAVRQPKEDAAMNKISLMLALFLTVPAAFADTGSDWLNNEISKLQNQIAARNGIAVEAERYQLAQGYALPAQVIVRSDDDAFTHELELLSKTISMFAMTE